jgi:hypothetical protein
MRAAILAKHSGQTADGSGSSTRAQSRRSAARTEATATWKCGLHSAMADSSDSHSMSLIASVVYDLRYAGFSRIIAFTALLYLA